jgi:hypothetical protein
VSFVIKLNDWQNLPELGLAAKTGNPSQNYAGRGFVSLFSPQRWAKEHLEAVEVTQLAYALRARFSIALIWGFPTSF